MGTGVLLFPNWLDATDYPVRLWGGSWLRKAPLDLLRDRYRVNGTVSRDANEDNTWYRIDLGTLRNIKGWAFPWHNLSRGDGGLTPGATISARGFWDGDCTVENADAAVIDKEVYPEIFPWGVLPREHEAWRDGRMTPAEIARGPVPILHVYRTDVVCRAFEIRIRDTRNPARRLRLSRMFLCGGYQPTRNFDWGSSIGVRDASVRSTGASGVDFYDKREHRYVAKLAFPDVAYKEALAWMLEMKAALGTTEQLFFSYDPDDLANLHRHSFPATMEELDDLSAVAAGFMSTAYQLRGVVG